MLLPKDKGYNKTYDDYEVFSNPLTVDQLIEKLNKAKGKYGGDCLVCITFDNDSGLESARTVYSNTFLDSRYIFISDAKIIASKNKEIF